MANQDRHICKHPHTRAQAPAILVVTLQLLDQERLFAALISQDCRV